MVTYKKKNTRRGTFWKNKIAKRFAIVGSVFLAVMAIAVIATLIWPEAFYGCREIIYNMHGSVIMVRSGQHCSPMVLGWITTIAAVCAAGCWLIALVWNWFGDNKRNALRVMKFLLTAIPIYEMILTPIMLLFWTVATDEWLEIISSQAMTTLEAVVMAMFFVGLFLAVLWLILLTVSAILVRNEKKRA